MLSLIETFGEENGVNPTALQSITRSWLSYLRAAQKNNAAPKAVRDDLIALGVFTIPNSNSPQTAKVVGRIAWSWRQACGASCTFWLERRLA